MGSAGRALILRGTRTAWPQLLTRCSEGHGSEKGRAVSLDGLCDGMRRMAGRAGDDRSQLGRIINIASITRGRLPRDKLTS